METQCQKPLTLRVPFSSFSMYFLTFSFTSTDSWVTPSETFSIRLSDMACKPSELN